MAAGPHSCLRWKNRIHHIQTQLSDFIDRQLLCDVTLVAEGQRFKAHQVILAASSSYFKNIFLKTPASQHPIIFLPNVTPQESQCILDYIYKGETVVPKDSMPGFLKTCELLGISDLCKDSSTPVEDDEDITPSLIDMTQNAFDEGILDSPPRSPESLVFLVASPEKQINSTAEGVIISKPNSGVIEISNGSSLMEVLSWCDKILGEAGVQCETDKPEIVTTRNFNTFRIDNLNQNQLNQQLKVVPTLVPLQNNTQEAVHQNDNSSSPVTQSMSSISDITQIDIRSEETCANNNLFNEDILDSPPRSPQSLIFSVANTEKQINSREKSVIIISQHNSEVIEISDDDFPMEQPDNQASKCDQILSMDKPNQLKVVPTPVPLQNNTQEDVHQNDNSSPVMQSISSISDMTQEETCAKDILDSPLRSPQSLIFSVANTEKRINSSEDSVIIISQNNSEVIEISDDDSPMEVPDNQASKCDKILSMDKPNRLNQQLKVVQTPLPSTDENSAFFVGAVYKCIESVPIGLKRTYCRKCCRCLHPVFWERHVKAHKNQI